MAWSRWESQLLATRGERLALFREQLHGDAGRAHFPGNVDGVEFANDLLVLVEIDAAGRLTALVAFDPDDLDAAYAELNARYSAGEGAPYAGLFASMEPIGTFAPGFERLLPDDFTITIHRRFAGTGSSMTRDEFAAWLRVTTHDLHARQRMRLDHILRISPAAELLVGRLFGTVAGGGDFETAVVNVIAHDGTRPHAIEAYDLDQLDVALARYDELTATATGPTRIENAATRSKDRFLASWHARDWDGVAAVYAPGFRVSDRRPMIRLELDPPQSLEGIRVGFDLFTMTWKVEVLATRGERLMLARAHWEGSGGAVGPSEGDMLEIVEVNDRETRELQIVLDPGDLDAAFDELDARYGAGEAAAHPHLRSTLGDFKRAFAARDWDAIVAMQAPDFILHDHRPLGWGTLDGAHYLDSLKALAALAADSRFRTDHVWLSRRGVLGIHVVHGTREGGAFEEPRVTVSEHDERGAYRRMDFYALAQLDEARARFAALRASPARIRTDRVPSRRVRANAATANAARFDTVIANRDADALSTLFSDVTEFVEHTTGVSYDREGVLRSLRSTLLRARDPIVRHEPLATLGDSLTLCRVSWSATGLEAAELDVGAYDMEVIGLLEVDAQGRRRRTERFPADRLGDAVARLYERYAELLPEGPARARAAATARAVAGMTAGRSNPDRYAAALAPAAEVVDHRMLGTWFARGAEAFLEQLRPMEELADEMAHRDDDVLGLRSDALLVRHTHYGTVRASGGAYENQFLFLKLFGPDGRVTHIEFFDPDRDAEALARFDELTAPAVVRFENAASRWRHRILEAWQARDWDRVSSGYAPSYRVIDRRKMMHMEVDRDRALESLRLLFEMRSKFTAQLLATRGDRLELVRSLWRFEGAERYAGPSEVDALRVREVDERGDAVAEVAFDPHDLDAAYAELGARFLAGEGAPYAAVLRTMQALGPAVIARDWERFASAFTSDFVAEDHRPLGFGTLSRDEYMASVRALLEMRPDARLRSLHVLALDDRRSIAVAGWVGAEPEGMFETSAIVVSQYDGTGIWRRADWYAVDHLDEAWARFAELRFDPLRIPPNAATRTGDRHREVVKARDMDALARLCVPTMVFDDRRRSVLLTGDLDVFLASSRVTAGSRIESTLLATAGDRLALSHCRWSDPAGTKWDLEVLSLDEVDAEGRTVAIIAFDADDRRAAGMEMFERFARSDEARSIPDAAFEGLRAVNAHDLDRLRAVLPDDFFMDDHRRTGLGRLDRETYLASLAALFEQAPDMTTENLRTIAVEPHGFFVLARNFGTLRGGGALESVYLRFTVYQGDRMGRVEMFEPDDLEIARARFEELASAGTRESAA
ncbi:MAG TPA: hypothetical protein VKA21_13545 [Candidatus Binatia bacterium]|nr:hypothetical protein [Candidatus Binatia bacterium]